MLTFIVLIVNSEQQLLLERARCYSYTWTQRQFQRSQLNGFHGKVLLLLDSYLLSIKYCLSARPAGSFRILRSCLIMHRKIVESSQLFSRASETAFELHNFLNALLAACMHNHSILRSRTLPSLVQIFRSTPSLRTVRHYNHYCTYRTVVRTFTLNFFPSEIESLYLHHMTYVMLTSLAPKGGKAQLEQFRRFCLDAVVCSLK